MLNNEQEAEYKKAFQEGDIQAFGRLYEAYNARIYRFIHYHVTDIKDAEDLTQIVFLKALKARNSYQDGGFPFSAWLFRIANTTISSFHRRNNTVNRHSQDIDLQDECFEYLISSPSPEEDIFDRWDDEWCLNRVRAIYPTLTGKQQEVLHLRFGKDLSIEEAANLLQTSQGAVKSRQHCAMAIIRDDIELQR